MPKGLYARALLIIIVPMVVLQSVVAFVFMERHWNLVTQRLSAGVVQDIAALIEIYKTYPQDADQTQLRAHRAGEARPGGRLPAGRPSCRRPGRSRSSRCSTSALRGDQQADRQAVLDRYRRPFGAGRDPHPARRCGAARVRPPQRGLRLELATSSCSGWSAPRSCCITVAILFLRNQIRPILRLADAAESFGKGREVPNFRPRGAREVRRAAAAFIEMKTPHRARDGAAHDHARRRLARPAHDPDALQARARADRRPQRDRGDAEGRRRDGAACWRPISRSRAAIPASSRRRPTWRRCSTSCSGDAERNGHHDQRRVPRPADRDGAAGGLQALPRQSGVECGAPCARDLDHRPSRPSLADGHGRRRRSRHSAASARRGVQAVPAARRCAQPGRGRHRARPRDRPRHRALARRRHHACRESPLGGLRATVRVPV